MFGIKRHVLEVGNTMVSSNKFLEQYHNISQFGLFWVFSERLGFLKYEVKLWNSIVAFDKLSELNQNKSLITIKLANFGSAVSGLVS